MRLLKTYILRLLIDQDTIKAEPDFHGSLQAIEEPQVHPFKSSQALLSLLQELTQEKMDDEIINLKEDHKP